MNLLQGETSINETNPFCNHALTYLKESSYEVDWNEFRLLLLPNQV